MISFIKRRELMRITVLIDNQPVDGLYNEWGLSLYIEHNGHSILLDTGASEKFAENAVSLQTELDRVEYGVLSHAHYDHADGMARFFELNTKASFYLRSGTEENCYSGEGADRHYIGIRQGILSQFAERICYVDGAFELYDGAYLLPHIADMSEAGKRAHMYLLKNGKWQADLFAHEQSLVLETEKGLVVFNSCCHGGADTIIKETEQYLRRPVYALFGGLHLFRSKDAAVKRMASALADSGVAKIYTGHCTGERAMELLSERLGDVLVPIYPGLVVDI